MKNSTIKKSDDAPASERRLKVTAPGAAEFAALKSRDREGRVIRSGSAFATQPMHAHATTALEDVQITRRRLARAMSLTQEFLADAEHDMWPGPDDLRRLASRLRSMHFVLTAAECELHQVLSLSARGVQS